MESLEAAQLPKPITDLISQKDFQEGGIFFGIRIPKSLPIPLKIVDYLCPDRTDKAYKIRYNADILHYLQKMTHGLQQDVRCGCGAHIMQKETDEEMLTRLIN